MDSPPSPSSSSLGALTTLLGCALFPPPSPSSGVCDFSDQTRRLVLRDLAAREFNAFLWVSLIAVTAFLLSRLFKLLRLWREADRIPGPPCNSFYGHCELVSRESLTEVLSTSHKKYGSVVKLWLGASQLLVSIKDPKLIKEILCKATDKIPSTGKAFNLAFGRSSLFASSFSEVEKRREALRTELGERLLDRRNVIPRKILDCIVERIGRPMAEGSVGCTIVSQHLAFTILGTTLFGDAFLAWSKANIYEELLMTIAKDAYFWASYIVSPFWKQGFRKYQHLCTELKCLTQDIVQLGRKSGKLFHCVDQGLSTGTKTAEKHFVYTTSCSKIQDPFFSQELQGHLGEIEEEESFGNTMGMMFHGCLTTSGLINNILMRLVQHLEIQDQIYTEISKAQKDSTTPVEENVDKMPLLLATIYEASRLLPAGPLLQRCSLDTELNLENGVTVPAGAALVVPVQLVQEDYSSWGGDACEFNPYRFLSQTKKTPDSVLKTSLSVSTVEIRDLSSLCVPFKFNATFFEQEVKQRIPKSTFILNEPDDKTAFLAFGSGIRACVGQKFVIKAVAELFASLLECYEMKLLSEATNNEKPKMNNCGFKHLPSPEIAFLRRNNCETAE